MPRVKIEVDGYKCSRCGHEWIPRGSEMPRVCPKCKSPFWDRERRMARFRADVQVQGKGWPPDRKKLQAIERRLGVFRRPVVRPSSTHVRLIFDVQATSEPNAEMAARRIVSAAARALGLRGPGYEATIKIGQRAVG